MMHDAILAAYWLTEDRRFLQPWQKAMEWASRELVKPHLEPGQDTVGVRVDVEHLAASPMGAMVVFRAKLTEADGRKLSFEVEAVDGDEVVGRGKHVRFVVDVERFAAGLKKRFAARPQG